MKNIMTVIGTRPEAIKLIPFIIALKDNKYLKNKVCISGQHIDLVIPLLIKNNIKIDYQIKNYKNDGSLSRTAAIIIEKISILLKEENPDLIVVQGDTTTAFASALAAFYSCVPIAHIEAGLRTSNLYSPWPEEAHRCLIDKITTYFFAPSKQAQEALITEGIDSKKIWLVGNTSIDAIRLVKNSLPKKNNKSDKKIIVVTIHRRENHGTSLINICRALIAIAKAFPNIKIEFCLHPNPAVCKPITRILSNIYNINLVPPMDHHSFIQLLDESIFIITDSGGIQEEASFMGKPVLIMRNTTERPEGIEEGNAKLVGTNTNDIIEACTSLLNSREVLSSMSKIHSSYGDGYAAQRIISIIEQELGKIER